MSSRNPFESEWRDCLRSHYLHVAKIGDAGTEHTLVGVMQQAGFSDADLVELRIRATLRTEDMDDGFVPDFELLEAQISRQTAAALQQTVESTISKSASSTADEPSSDAVSEQLEVKPGSLPSDEYYAPPDDTPRQLSLF